MTKFLKKFLFWIFISMIVVIIGYLGIITYNDANCTRGKMYLVKKYEVEEKNIKSIKYQEYAYDDITDCDSLWFKKCTSDDNLKYEYTLEIDGVIIRVKEFKDGSFSDDYENGIIRENYLQDEKNNNSLEEVN